MYILVCLYTNLYKFVEITVPFSKMISEPTYLAARVASHRIAEHFSKQLDYSDAERRYIPDTTVIETLIDTAFWASLRREEGYEPKISMAFVPPDLVSDRLVFQHTQRFTPYQLVKLSPAVVQPGLHLGVWMDADNFYIWGTTHEVPTHAMVVEVVEAGLLVVKQKHHTHARKFVNVAVLKGNQIKVIEDNQWGLVESLTENMLVQLALAMRNHGRGALLLVVPPNSTAWLHSIVKPIKYLVESHKRVPTMENRDDDIEKETFQKMIKAVGGYSAIDGATVITEDYQLLAFGAKVARSPHALPVDRLMITEPVAGSVRQLLDATTIGGTRHLAAAQFVNDQHDSLAMVASQDGTFTVFSWSEKEQLVHGHRIDTLLM